MALIIEAPKEVYSLYNNNNIKLFLAGGIAGCEDWQNYVVGELQDVKNLTIYNPRRKNSPIEDPLASEEQITWEFNHLRDADMILFWFSRGSLNPIVLYEYGAHGMFSERHIFVGIDPEYTRKQDVMIQTTLGRSEQIIHTSLDTMIEEIKELLREINNNCI